MNSSSAWLSHGLQARDRVIGVYSLLDTVLSMPRPADSIQRRVCEWVSALCYFLDVTGKALRIQNLKSPTGNSLFPFLSLHLSPSLLLSLLLFLSPTPSPLSLHPSLSCLFLQLPLCATLHCRLLGFLFFSCLLFWQLSHGGTSFSRLWILLSYSLCLFATSGCHFFFSWTTTASQIILSESLFSWYPLK